jgi:hypothetical protein
MTAGLPKVFGISICSMKFAYFKALFGIPIQSFFAAALSHIKLIVYTTLSIMANPVKTGDAKLQV